MTEKWDRKGKSRTKPSDIGDVDADDTLLTESGKYALRIPREVKENILHKLRVFLSEGSPSSLLGELNGDVPPEAKKALLLDPVDYLSRPNCPDQVFEIVKVLLDKAIRRAARNRMLSLRRTKEGDPLPPVPHGIKEFEDIWRDPSIILSESQFPQERLSALEKSLSTAEQKAAETAELGVEVKIRKDLESTMRSEHPAVELVPACEADIQEIMRIYNQLIYPRELFVFLAKRATGFSFEDIKKIQKLLPAESALPEISEEIWREKKDETIKRVLGSTFQRLSGGGELWPIAELEWRRRIKEEYVVLVRSKPSEQQLQGQIFGVLSAVIPVGHDNQVDHDNLKKILTEIGRIKPEHRVESEKSWFEKNENPNAYGPGIPAGSRIVMIRDAFCREDNQNRGLLFILFQSVLQNLLERGIILKEQIDEWSMFFWVNQFRDVGFEGAEATTSEPFRDPVRNQALLVATGKMGGGNIGETFHDGPIPLPSLEDEHTPFIHQEGDNTASARRISLAHHYVNARVPMATLAWKSNIDIIKLLNSTDSAQPSTLVTKS